MAGAQGTHAAVPFAKVPTGQLEALNAQAVEPSALKAPAGQGRHTAAEGAPIDTEKVPAAQGAHAAAPAEGPYVPAAQLPQVALEEALQNEDYERASQLRDEIARRSA